MLSTLVKKLVDISEKPSGGPSEYAKWVEQEDFLEVMKSLHNRDEMILYAGLTYCFLYGIAVPEVLLDPIPVDDLMNWTCNPFSSWALCHGYRDGNSERQMWIEPPLRNQDSKTLESGEQLLFIRNFEGFQEGRPYVELSQKVSHLLDIHFIPERSAYCRLDENGDFDDIVQIQTIKGNLVVTIKREDMDMLLAMFKSSYILMFDSTRFDSESFSDWKGGPNIHTVLNKEFLYFRGRMNPNQESYLRGFKLIKPLNTDRVRRRLEWKSPVSNQYASYISMDWKHKKVHECSCDPTRLGNYFVESDLPFETSPAFFRPEVLLKYKSDPDKYRIERRSIRCRGAWSLKSFDINEAGQIHVYLCDLNKLPFPEQLYWKSFNEEPKTGISERAFTTDFLGEWDSAPDPLVILKRLLQSLNKQDVPWWSLKDPQLLDRVSYVVTSSKEEWANEIMVLDQLLIEGFNKSYFKTKAKEFGITVDPTWSSLKLIVELLKKGQIDEVDITTIVSPLRSLHELRNKMKGHAPGAEARKIRETIISKHGDLKAHFRFLVHQCERAFSLLTEFGNSNNIF